MRRRHPSLKLFRSPIAASLITLVKRMSVRHATKRSFKVQCFCLGDCVRVYVHIIVGLYIKLIRRWYNSPSHSPLSSVPFPVTSASTDKLLNNVVSDRIHIRAVRLNRSHIACDQSTVNSHSRSGPKIQTHFSCSDCPTLQLQFRSSTLKFT